MEGWPAGHALTFAVQSGQAACVRLKPKQQGAPTTCWHATVEGGWYGVGGPAQGGRGAFKGVRGSYANVLGGEINCTWITSLRGWSRSTLQAPTHLIL